MNGKWILACAILLAAILAGSPARCGESASEEIPTVATTREQLLGLLSACRDGVGGGESLSATWRFRCPLCALLRSDDWAASRGVRPELAMIERAMGKPHGEWHGLTGVLERGLRAGIEPRSQAGLVDRLDLCWLELGILLDAASAAN